MTTPKRAPRSGANRRAFESPPDVIDRTVWARPERQPAAITLPAISITIVTVTDDDLGLPPDPWAQRAAERALLAARAFTARQAADPRTSQIQVPGVSVTADAGSAVPVDPEGRLSSDDAQILVELQRLAARPLPDWMIEERSAA